MIINIAFISCEEISYLLKLVQMKGLEFSEEDIALRYH